LFSTTTVTRIVSCSSSWNGGRRVVSIATATGAEKSVE